MQYEEQDISDIGENSKITNKVEFNNRSFLKNRGEFVIFIFFIFGLISWFSCAMFLVSLPKYKYISDGSKSFINPLEMECRKNNNIQRLLTENNNPLAICGDETKKNLWCAFEVAPEIPTVTILLIPIVSFLWMLFLYFATKIAVWLSILCNIAIVFSIGAVLLDFENSQQRNLSIIAYLFIIFGVIWLVLALFYRKHIFDAARHLHTALLAISKNIPVIYAALITEIILLGFLALNWFFLLESVKVAPPFYFKDYECQQDNIEYENILKKVHKINGYMLFFTLWGLKWLDQAKLVSTSIVIGSWCFGQELENTTTKTAFKAWKISMTFSAVVNSISSIIVTIVELIFSKANSKLWWTNPLDCILKCVMVIFSTCLRAFTRFAVISHAFTGNDFFISAKLAFHTLKRNFKEGYVVSTVGVSVLRTGASGLSISFGLLTWIWFDNVLDTNSFFLLFNSLEGFQGVLIFVFFCIYFWLINHPLLTLFIVIILNDSLFIEDTDNDYNEYYMKLIPCLAALFISSISMIILNFNSDVVLDALDTVFMAYAIDSDNGKTITTETAKIYAIMKDGSVEGIKNPAAAPFPTQDCVASSTTLENQEVSIYTNTIPNNDSQTIPIAKVVTTV